MAEEAHLEKESPTSLDGKPWTKVHRSDPFAH
jgi:hypothetical protein